MANIVHMTFRVEDLTVTWALPVSKTDYTATGCKRTWGCTCIDPERPGKICPYHVAYEHKEMLRARLWKQFAADKEHMDELRKEGIDPWDDEDLPLFPDKEGNEVTADAMVALVDALAEFSGGSLTNAEGVRRFGRHSWRSTGAVWLTGVMMIEVARCK